MSWNTILTALCGGCIAVLMFYSNGRIEKLTLQNTALQTQLEANHVLYLAEKEKAANVIKLQNEAIEQYKFNLQDYRRRVSAKEQELKAITSQKQELAKASLAEDSSINNQLRLIDMYLREFSYGKD